MSTRKITFILAAALSLLVIAGTKVSQLTRTRSLQETSRFLVSTQDATTGRWSSRYVTAPDLATNLGPWITNSGSGGGSGNYIGNSAGKGTNTDFYGTTELFGADFFSGATANIFSNSVTIGGDLSLQGYSDVAATLTALGTNNLYTSNALYSLIIGGGITAATATNISEYFATNVGAITSNKLWAVMAPKTNATLYGTVNINGGTANEILALDASKNLVPVTGISATEAGYLDGATGNLQSQINAITSSSARMNEWVASITNTILLNVSSNIVGVLSNAPNNSRIRIASGTYTVTPSKVLSNGLGAINILNKTNLIIEAEEGAVIDGSAAIGELLWATNCDGLIIKGLTFKGSVATNYVTVSAIGHVWGGVSYHNLRNFSFERNRVIDHHDHGILDMGSQGGNWSPSTNNVWIERNYFSNIGSKRTNDPVVIDGAAIVPSGGVIQFNEIEDSLRGIEPYIDLNTTRLSPGLIVRGNVIRNTLEHGILVAGSTNMHDLIIEDNRITWDIGYTRRGSNVITSADGININGGQRATIRNNTIINAPNFDINTTSDLEKFGFIIEGNKGRGSFYSSSGGGGIELSASSAQYPSRGFVVRNNTIENKRSYGLSANGLRDARFSGNTLINVGTNGTMAVWVYAGGGQLNSNVIFEATSITGDERAAKAANGFQIESGNKEITIAGSQIKGIATPISNNAGAEVVTLDYSRTATNAVVVNWELVRASNAVAGMTGVRVGTNASPSLYTNIQFVTSANTVVSNAGNGTASIHINASSSGSGGTNSPAATYGVLTATNIFLSGVTNLGTNAVQGWDVAAHMTADSGMFGNTTLVITNQASFTNTWGNSWAGEHVARIRHSSGTLTLASLHPIVFNGPVHISTSATNWLRIRWQNGSWHGSVSDVPTTGSGAYALSNAPTITGATLTLASTSTNIIESQTEDTAPSTNDTVLVHDKDTASLKRVAITNLRGGGSGSVDPTNQVLVNLIGTVADNATNRLAKGQVRTFDGTNYLGTNIGWALNYPPNNGFTRMVFKGDSLTFGTGGGTPYHTYLTNLYLTTTNWIVSTNAGVAGQTAATMNSNFAGDIGQYAPSGGTNGFLFLWGGINDIAAGTSAATTYASLTNIYGKAKTNGTGWKIVAFTVTGSMRISSAQEHERHLLNNLIRNSPWWDYLVDVAAYCPPPPESSWYADYIHFSNAGYSAIATLVAETLQRGERNLFMPFPVDARKQFMGSGAYRGLNASIIASDSLPGLTLENSSTSDALSLLPISSGLVNLYYKVGAGNFAASDVRETLSIGAHSFNMNVASATNVLATNSFVLPTAQTTAPYGLTTKGAQIFSDGTNLLVVIQDGGGTRTTNKLTMTAWP